MTICIMVTYNKLCVPLYVFMHELGVIYVCVCVCMYVTLMSHTESHLHLLLSPFCHQEFGHLASNMIWLWIFAPSFLGM